MTNQKCSSIRLNMSSELLFFSLHSSRYPALISARLLPHQIFCCVPFYFSPNSPIWQIIIAPAFLYANLLFSYLGQMPDHSTPSLLWVRQAMCLPALLCSKLLFYEERLLHQLFLLPKCLVPSLVCA